MLWLYRIFSGFLRVRFYGDFCEKALSLCAQNGINLWNSKTNNNAIESYILVRDFKALRNIISGNKIRVHILKKFGVPFITERYKKRYGIFVGAIAFFLILELMTGFIWVIDINGNHKIKDTAILEACNKIGVYQGVKKNSIFPKAEREKLILELDGIAWASMNIKGSRLSVNITETKEKEKSEKYSNLKSKTDGIIVKMDIVSGTSVVKVGDAVKEGDLLVSGIIETADDTRFVNSKGTITAKTKRTLKFKENLKQTLQIPTGRVKTKTALEFYGIKLPLYLGVENKPYIDSKKEQTLKFFGADLPIKIHKKRFEFYNNKEIVFSYNTVCNRLEKALQEEIKSLEALDYKVLNKSFSKSGDTVTLTASLELTESIAFEDKLLINTGN